MDWRVGSLNTLKRAGGLMVKRTKEFFRGCMVGGAIGDALGWPVEFMRLSEIQSAYGDAGIQDLVIASSGVAEITDDTQMTLFTAEGILRAYGSEKVEGTADPLPCVFEAYQRWLLTQSTGGRGRSVVSAWVGGDGLLGLKALHSRRAPGNSCLSALGSGKVGTIVEPINSSKGCGGVMRVAPVGLFYRCDQAFERGADFAALTHGHPSGYLSAGALAYLIALLIEGHELEAAVRLTLEKLSSFEYNEECCEVLQKALDLAVSQETSTVPLSDVEAISQLGEGWVGEEALAISVYCALRYKTDFEKALIAAVNHNGDSDSTGAITGNILGAYLGLGELPLKWINKLELKEVLFNMADELLALAIG